MNIAEQARHIFNDTLSFVDPVHMIGKSLSWDPDRNQLTIQNQTFVLENGQPLYLIGAGKASVSMALAVEKILGPRIRDGIIIAPEAYKKNSITQVFKGSHPLPDKESLSSSYELINFLKKLPEGAFVINLVSGGTSSLFCLPAGDLEVEEVREIYSLLIESGASIHEINTVRKVFSSVKGGQLLQYFEGKQLVDLMISDITDDDKRMIGSGPSIAQAISATEAFKVLKQYHLYNQIPHTARRYLALQMNRESKTGGQRATHDIENHHSFIIGSALMMARQAASIAENAGFKTEMVEDPVTGTVDKVTEYWMSALTHKLKQSNEPSAVIRFGEPTVNVTGGGLGGRNQELSLRMALELEGLDADVAFLSAGSDGIDGPTDAAGAVVTPGTCKAARSKELEPEAFLAENDSYHFFSQAGGHIKTGPTRNNLMDLQILLIR